MVKSESVAPIRLQSARPASQTLIYPLPGVEELLASLSDGNLFSEVDMSQAHLQLPSDEESKKYVTHRGLYRHNRLPFGISSAPSIFQRTAETLLQEIKGVLVYIDDILITGLTIEEHLSTFDKVLENWVWLVCFSLQPSIEYLGHVMMRMDCTEEKVRSQQPRNSLKVHYDKSWLVMCPNMVSAQFCPTSWMHLGH